MAATRTEPLLHLRSVFISDVHLGFHGCAAGPLLELLSRVRIEQLFLLGDIVDLSSMRRSMFWPREHHEVLRTIFRLATSGTRVIYVPGNHDEELRAYVGATFNGVEIVRDMIYTAADGRRFWLLHGDEFDGVVKCSPWLAWLGNHLYDFLLAANPAVNGMRRLLGLKPASLAAFLKSRVPSAMAYIESFEHAVAREARRRGVDGVVCGHIHRPMICDVDGILYCNDGDWVENCSLLAEDYRGNLRILRWPHIGAHEAGAVAGEEGLLDAA
jgi:UDP-2,3-diacylglucosamine pyrophosphatase LpxH